MEIWKDIKGYEGLYQVSNYGNVKSLTIQLIKKERVLKQRTTRKGYIDVHLCKESVCKRQIVHRLVAIAFLDNKLNKTQVNHINGIKSDNRVSNLEWATQSENMKHAFANGLNKISINHLNAVRKKVINIENGRIYLSCLEASIDFGIKYGTLKCQLLGKNPHKTPLRYYEK